MKKDYETLYKERVARAMELFHAEIVEAVETGCDYAELLVDDEGVDSTNPRNIHFCCVGDTSSTPKNWSWGPNNLQFFI